MRVYPADWFGLLRMTAQGQNRKQASSILIFRSAPMPAVPRTARNVTGNGPSSSDQGEQSLHQLAVWPCQRFEDREMVGPVDWQQTPRQPALDPRLRVVNRLAA